MVQDYDEYIEDIVEEDFDGENGNKKEEGCLCPNCTCFITLEDLELGSDGDTFECECGAKLEILSINPIELVEVDE